MKKELSVIKDFVQSLENGVLNTGVCAFCW